MKKNKSYWIGALFTIALAFFIWLSWKKLDKFIGNENIMYFILLGIVVLGFLLGKIDFDKILKKLG